MLLAAVKQVENRVVLFVKIVRFVVYGSVALAVAVGMLHLNDLRTQICQKSGRDRRSHKDRKRNNAYAFQRFIYGNYLLSVVPLL